MNLYEYEGKRLLSSYGVPIPHSEMVYSANASAPLPYPFVLKAQVMTGGRGKAGGIKVCENEAAFEANAASILGMSIKGHQVHGLLCEETSSCRTRALPLHYASECRQAHFDYQCGWWN